MAVCGVAFVSNVGDFWAGSTSVERETLRLGVYLTEYQLVKRRIGVIHVEYRDVKAFGTYHAETGVGVTKN